ncbi:MAG: hypothetical protein ACRDGT_03475 [Candidatus Limnocylindria bacterium]
MDPRLRIAPAALALAIPAAAFAFNSFISMRERGFFDPVQLIVAAGFFVLALMVWRRYRIGVYAGIVFSAVYLASAVVGGPIQFAAYWVVAILVLAESLRARRGPAAAT